jgi:hypothetical protein
MCVLTIEEKSGESGTYSRHFSGFSERKYLSKSTGYRHGAPHMQVGVKNLIATGIKSVLRLELKLRFNSKNTYDL